MKKKHKAYRHITAVSYTHLDVYKRQVRAPVNSFEFHRCRRTPQVGYLTLSLSR